MTNKTKTLALLAVLPFITTACTLQDLPVIGGLFGGSSNDPVTLTMWGLWEDPQVMQALIQSYQEQHPNVTINYEDRSIMDPVEYKERVFTRAGDENSEIDVALVHNSWMPRLHGNFATAPEAVATPDTVNERFYPVVAESGVIDGQVYALPAYYDGLVLVYNRAHFEEVGQRFPPTAWEEFRRLALELTIRGDDENLIRGGAAIGSASNIDHFADILGLMFSQAGVDMENEVTSRPAIDALTYYTNFVTEDGVWNTQMPEATQAFIQGKTSMIFVPTWQVLDILRAMPNVNDVGVAPVPQALPDSPATWGSFWMYAVPKNSDNVKVAWDFINFITQDAQQQLYFSEASKVRAFGPAYASTSLAQEIISPYLRPAVDTAPYATSAEIAARAGNARQVDALRTAIETVLANSSSAEQALETVQTELSR